MFILGINNISIRINCVLRNVENSRTLQDMSNGLISATVKASPDKARSGKCLLVVVRRIIHGGIDNFWQICVRATLMLPLPILNIDIGTF